MSGKSLLSDERILHHLHEGGLTIHPFNLKQLNNSSYDVCLGEHFYRESKGSKTVVLGDSKTLEGLWVPGVTIKEGDAQYIELAPGETILGHTVEYIGGHESITTHMQTRSTLGRIGISLCKCSGWGDCHYHSRWTMEITNHLQHHSVRLRVGYPVGQIVFHETDRVSKVGYTSRYQPSTDLDTIIADWKPELMLPKFRDSRI